MRKYYFTLFLAIFLYQPLIADSLELKELFPFDRYPVNTVFKGKSLKNIDVTTHPRAREFRTMLREGAKQGVNFAGHYTIVTWGCGTACLEFGIIGVHTGKVFFPANLLRVIGYGAGDFQLNGWTEIEESLLNSKLFLTENSMFRKNSNLLVVCGLPEGEEVKYIQDTQYEHEGKGLYYFSWEGNELKLLGKLLLSSDKVEILHLVTNGNISDLMFVQSTDQNANSKKEIEEMMKLTEEQAIFAEKQRIQKLPKPQHGHRKIAREANAKGLASLKENQIPQAITAFEEAYQADPADVEVVTNLGYAYLLLDGQPLAEDYLMRALYLSPDSVNAWLNLGHFYALNKAEDKAITCLANAYRFSKNRDKTLEFLKDAFIKAENENFKNAIKKTLQLPLISDSKGEIQRKLSLLRRSNNLVFVPSFLPQGFALRKVVVHSDSFDEEAVIDYEITYSKDNSESLFTISSMVEKGDSDGGCGKKVITNSIFFGEISINFDCNGGKELNHMFTVMPDQYMQQRLQREEKEFNSLVGAGRFHHVTGEKIEKEDFIQLVKSLEPLPQENAENSQQPLVLRNLVGLWLHQSYLEDIKRNRAPQTAIEHIWALSELELEYSYPSDAVLAIAREEGRYQMTSTNFHETDVVELLRIEPTEKSTHYNIVYMDVSEKTDATSLYPQWDKAGQVEKINFGIQNNTYLRIPLLDKEGINFKVNVERYLNKLVLAGTYKDDKGRIFSFSETQEARWENEFFPYSIVLDPTESECEYFCGIGKEDLCYCYSWINNQLKLSKMLSEGGFAHAGKLFAVLTPQ